TVERTNGTTGEVAFSGVLVPGSANGADFGGTVPVSFSGTIADGATSGTFSIAVTGDRSFEPNETFTVRLTDATNSAAHVYVGVEANEQNATGTIINDDTVQIVGFSSPQAFVTEGDTGTVTLNLVVQRTGDGGTEGDVSFSGTFTPLDTNADDYG